MLSVLVLCDDIYHPGKVVRQGLAPLSNGELRFDFVEDVANWTPSGIGDYRVIVLAKSNHTSHESKEPWVTEGVQEQLRTFVHGGGGLLAIHSGTATYDKVPGIRKLLGGVFTHHPEQCEVTVDPKPGHHLTGNVAAFTLKDEHYHMEIDDGSADVFLTTTSMHGSQPGGWTRAVDAGRVCVLTPGHNVEVWLHPSFQALMKNALAWCSGDGR